MMVAASLLCFALLGAALPARPGLRSRLLSAAVLWGVLVAVITEIVSVWQLLTPAVLGAAWGVAAILAACAVAVRRARQRRMPAVGSSSPARAIVAPLDVLALAAVALVVLGTGLVAAFGWSGQWDSMVYHLPRISHWLQNGHVAFYPTNVVRQLFNPPWAEYAALHLMAVGGDERWGNGVAWASMIGSLVGVSLIAKHLDAGVRGQVVAVFVCATIRMGILQAAGTQNDYVTAFWLVCATEAVLAPTPAAASIWGGLRLGAALGLALLTKGTAVLFAAPMLVALWPWGGRPPSPMLRSGVLAVLVAMALNAPHTARNLTTFGSPLGPASPGSATGDDTDSLANTAMTPGLLASNLVRNLSNHVGTWIGPIDAASTSFVERAHRAVGLDPSDPRTTRLYPLPAFAIDGHPANPDRTGSPVHVAAVVGAMVSIVTVPAFRRRPRLARYVVGLLGGFIAFSLVLKWQPWHARLQLPWFVLAAPVVGVVAERWRPRTLIAVSTAMGLLAVPPLLKNYLGPLVFRGSVFMVPRTRQYFHAFNQPSEPRMPDYFGAVAALRSVECTDVGLLVGWDDWEHPWWVLLSDEGRRPVRVRHVGVENPSAHLGSREPAFVPCAILVGTRAAGGEVEIDGRLYRLAWTGSDWRVFTMASSSAAATVR